MTVLFVNACLRNEESRTLGLCREYIEVIDSVQEVNMDKMRLEPFYAESVAYRAQLEAAGVFDDPVFDLAKQFAEADEIVVGAQYWDRSFPAALKVYLEHVSVCDITFHYTDDARCEGLCRARHLTYLTTCGGSVAGANLGYEYLCGIARMFGIPEVRFAVAENLDVRGIDVEAQLAEAREKVAALKAAR